MCAPVHSIKKRPTGSVHTLDPASDLPKRHAKQLCKHPIRLNAGVDLATPTTDRATSRTPVACSPPSSPPLARYPTFPLGVPAARGRLQQGGARSPPPGFPCLIVGPREFFSAVLVPFFLFWVFFQLGALLVPGAMTCLRWV